MPNREDSTGRVVWLPLENCFGRIVGPLGTYFTLVSFTKFGIEYELLMETEEFTLLEDLIEYDPDDD